MAEIAKLKPMDTAPTMVDILIWVSTKQWVVAYRTIKGRWVPTGVTLDAAAMASVILDGEPEGWTELPLPGHIESA